MFGSIPDWDFFFEQCYRCVKPGGWVEIAEHSVQPIAADDTQPPGHFYYEWGAKVEELGEKNGKSFTIWKEAKERLGRAGFVDVQEVKYDWPMNGWSRDRKLREIGRWNQLRLSNGVESFMLRLLTAIGGVSEAKHTLRAANSSKSLKISTNPDKQWSYEQSQLFLAEMRKTVRDYSCHAYLPG